MNWKRLFLIISIVIVILGGGVIMFNRSNKKIVNQAYSFKEFNKINVDIPTGDIIFKTSNKYGVSYSGLEKIAPDVKVENGNLKISFSKAGVHVNMFNLKQLNSKIVIEMPKEELADLNIENANGNVSAGYLATKKADIDLANGNIAIKELKTGKGVSFDTAKGNIEVNKCNASGYDLDTSLGKITVSGKKRGDSFEKNSDTENVLEADTSLGSIKIN